jgi:ubiquinone biosynthesis protein
MLGALRHGTRLARSAIVLARHDALWPDSLGEPPAWLAIAGKLARILPPRAAPASGTPDARFASALENLGPAYVKLGQVLATRPDLVGVKLAAALSALQDRMEPFPAESARAVLEAEFGAQASDLFVEFGPAVAAASIAQVHPAMASFWLGHNRAPQAANDSAPQGAGPRAVAVKILRPNIETAFARDLDSFFWAAQLIERFEPKARRLEPVKLVQTLADSVALELDLRLEAAAAAEFAELIAGDPDFRVPRVDWQRTSRRVLTTEWITGTPIGDRDRLAGAGHDLPALATRLMRSFLTHALRDGYFHADMHQGNLFVDAEGRIVAVDFGIMGRLDPPARRYLAEILMGFITRDYKRVAEVHFEAGYVPKHHSVEAFAQALRAIGEPIFGRPAQDISMARLFTQLFETTALFDMHLRPELVLLQKTMVVVEGVARHLDPEHNLWEAARPVVERFLARELGPEGRLQSAAENARAIGRIVTGLPGFIETMEKAAQTYAERGLTLDPASVEAIGRAEARARRAEWLALLVALGALIALVLALL